MACWFVTGSVAGEDIGVGECVSGGLAERVLEVPILVETEVAANLFSEVRYSKYKAYTLWARNVGSAHQIYIKNEII